MARHGGGVYKGSGEGKVEGLPVPVKSTAPVVKGAKGGTGVGGGAGGTNLQAAAKAGMDKAKNPSS
jgi:hypothetical protein